MSATKEQMRGEKGGQIVFLIIIWYSPQVKLLSWLDKALQCIFFAMMMAGRTSQLC